MEDPEIIAIDSIRDGFDAGLAIQTQSYLIMKLTEKP
jgi:hypothetical protein